MKRKTKESYKSATKESSYEVVESENLPAQNEPIVELDSTADTTENEDCYDAETLMDIAPKVLEDYVSEAAENLEESVESYFEEKAMEPATVVALSEEEATLFEQAPSYQATACVTARQTGAKLTIVWHKVSARSRLASDIRNQLAITDGDYVDIKIINQQVYVIKSLAQNGLCVLKDGWIYNKQFVQAITNAFGFTFGINSADEAVKNSTNHLFRVEYKQYKGQPMAIITP